MTADEPVLPAVGMTAVGVAAVRAAETQRQSRLFADPLAAGFVRSGWTDAIAGRTVPRSVTVVLPWSPGSPSGPASSTISCSTPAHEDAARW